MKLFSASANALALWSLASVVSADVASDLAKITEGRIPFIIQAIPGYGQTTIMGWLNSQTPAGQFPNVDYTTGCPARRANWPAQIHWNQVRAVAAAYLDLLPRTATLTQKPPRQFHNNATVKIDIDEGMNWWFNNDFTEPACLDKGGVDGSTCPCGTSGMWNTNWYSNVILIPRLVGHTCLLMDKFLTMAQRETCVRINQRVYDRVDTEFNGLGRLTGANTLDVAANSVIMGLLKYSGGLSGGPEAVAESYRRAHAELVIQNAVKADGIRPDGSFGQHGGILYNGNYGKDYTNLVLQLELPAAGTQYAANDASKEAFGVHIDGLQWMIYKNIQTGVLHWDFSTVGRMISFPVIDSQATESININLTKILTLGQQWGSELMTDAATSLLQDSATANAGDLVGTRIFYDNDYMVHRGTNFVTTLKMLSSRTTNTECVNAQNPFGFHLGQGNTYTYVKGSEYEDIAGGWNWNLIPGITTDYAATPLNCDNAGATGVETFAGGVTNGRGLGLGAMIYTNPLAKKFGYKKAWFFFDDDVQHVTVAGIWRNSGNTEVYSVLDQKKLTGNVFYNGAALNSAGSGMTNFTQNVDSLWHDGMGYTFGNTAGQNSAPALTVDIKYQATGNWAGVGTSVQPWVPVDLFTAFVKHDPTNLSKPFEYSVYPGVSSNDAFVGKAADRSVGSVKNDADISAVLDGEKQVLMAAVWNAAGGLVSVPLSDIHCQNYGNGGTTRRRRADPGVLTVTSDKPITYILDLNHGELTVADPSQSLSTVKITITKQGGSDDPCMQKIKWDSGSTDTKTMDIQLPSGAVVGKSVMLNLMLEGVCRRSPRHKRRSTAL